MVSLMHFTYSLVLMMIPEQNPAKPKKRIVKLSWEITTIYSDVIKTLAANHGRHTGHSDDEDEDEMEAHEDSVKRLRVRFLWPHPFIVYSRRTIGRRRSNTAHDKGRIHALLGMPPSVIHIS